MNGSPTYLLVIFLFTCEVVWSLREPRSTYSSRQLLVGYWGQNGAGPSSGPANYEKPLLEVCQTTKYDILALAFIVVFFDSRNKGLPALNFAYHCETPVSQEYPFLLRCPKIEEGIKECQRQGKKVLMSIGGSTGDGTLPSPVKAKEFAHTLFDLFLGGSKHQKIRPFGSAIMDGIDMDIEGGRGDNYPDFIRELRRLMDNDPRKSYLITGAPQCPYPDYYLGPQTPGSGLEETGQLVDHLYIQFYNNYCYTGAGKWFTKSLNQWLSFSKRIKPRGPLIFIGLPAATRAASGAKYYRPPAELAVMYQSVRNLPGVGGIMLWDVSWDQNNVIDGQRYSEYVFKELGGGAVPPTHAPPPPITTEVEAPSLPVTTRAPPPPITIHTPLPPTVPTWLGTRLDERRQILRSQCEKKPPNPNFIEEADFTRFIVIEDLKLVFCFIPKISCTTWKRVLYQAKNNGTVRQGNPHSKMILSWLKDYSPVERRNILDTYYKAMFVREPFSRLLSAFKSQVERRSPTFIKRYDPNFPDELKGLTNNRFPLFVSYVLSHNHSSITMNHHWRSYEQICPCEVNYDFIGHFENLGQEAPHLLKTIGVDHYVTFPEYHPSNSRPYLLEYYSKLTKDEIFKLGKFYELDFKLFGYNFPGPVQAVLDVNDASE